MSAPSSLPTRGATGRGAHSGHEALAKGLGWFSIGLGAVELVGARALCQALGLDGHETLVRVYGARELATGAAILTSHDPTPWIWGRVIGDVVDLATLAAGLRDDNSKRDNLTLAIAAVAGVTVLDAVCAQGLTADKRLTPPKVSDSRPRSGFPRPIAAMRGAASDFAVPADFRIPGPLRPWASGQPAASRPASSMPLT